MKCLRILGFEEEALHCFNRGILTYAATVYEIGGVLPLPHDLEAMNAVEHSEDMTGIADSALHSIKSFEQLLQRLAPILQKEQAGLEIAQIGAGVLHAITIESLLKPAVQQEVVTEDHAEAALLRALDMELTELSVPHEEGSGEADEGGASINPIVTIDAMPPFPLGLTRIVETDKRRDGLRYEEATRPTFKLDK